MEFARQPQPSSGVWTAPSGFLLYFPLFSRFSPSPPRILGRLLWGLGICFPLPLLSFFSTTSGLVLHWIWAGVLLEWLSFPLPAPSRPSQGSGISFSWDPDPTAPELPCRRSLGASCGSTLVFLGTKCLDLRPSQAIIPRNMSGSCSQCQH